MKMEYKTFAIIGIMWAFCAHCSVGDSKLTHQKFPKTVNDLSFIEMMQLKAEGYKPWFDKKAYVPIVLKKDGGAQQPAEPFDYCPDRVNYAWAEPAGGDEFRGVSHSVVAGNGGVVCEQDKQVNDRKCAQYCTLSELYKAVESDVCVYSNSAGLYLEERINDDGTPLFLVDGGYKIRVVFSGIEDVDVDGAGNPDVNYNKGVKIGKIKDKAQFNYCIALYRGEGWDPVCHDGELWGDDGCSGSGNDDEGEAAGS